MKDGKELATEFADFVNSYNFDKQGFINQFCREHRTLQQSAVRLMFELMEHIASDEYRFDGRNEGSHKVCKDLMEGFKMKKTKDEVERFGSSDVNENCKPSKYLGFI